MNALQTTVESMGLWSMLLSMICLSFGGLLLTYGATLAVGVVIYLKN